MLESEICTTFFDSDDREFMSSMEEALKKVKKKFRCAKDVSEANGVCEGSYGLVFV